MNLDQIKTIQQLASFLEGNEPVLFIVNATKDERYQFVETILARFAYAQLTRQDKGVVLRFLQKVARFSRQQLTRLIHRYYEQGKLVRYHDNSYGFKTHYTAADIRLLAQLDRLHDTPNGLRVKKLCERAYFEFQDKSYERLQAISISHIYNLRRSCTYQRNRCHYSKTKSKKGVQYGERRKPNNQGKPGYIRIDTVHQGDYDGKKGVYHINAVDEVTQFEIVASVEKISEMYLIPVLEELLLEFPFKIINFHSDNGSEYINKTVASLLSKLLVEFTKSRPRHSNDNALAEGKNAAVVRKVLGYLHIPQHYASLLNAFHKKALNPYINYHRPCLYPTIEVDHKGKQKKRYYYENTMTPYDKFRTLPNAESYLRDGITFKQLDDLAHQMTDNEAALYLQRERQLLFNTIHEDSQKRA